MFLFQLPGHPLLNVAELFNIQGSEISYAAESVQEKLWLAFSERTSVCYVIYEQLITVYFAVPSYAKQYFQIHSLSCDKTAVNLNENSEANTIFSPAKSHNFLTALQTSTSAMQKSTREPEESQQLIEKHKNQEQGALQQVKSGESLA